MGTGRGRSRIPHHPQRGGSSQRRVGSRLPALSTHIESVRWVVKLRPLTSSPFLAGSRARRVWGPKDWCEGRWGGSRCFQYHDGNLVILVYITISLLLDVRFCSDGSRNLPGSQGRLGEDTRGKVRSPSPRDLPNSMSGFQCANLYLGLGPRLGKLEVGDEVVPPRRPATRRQTSFGYTCASTRVGMQRRRQSRSRTTKRSHRPRLILFTVNINELKKGVVRT